MRKPAGIFDEESELDISGFTRKPDTQAVREAAEKLDFVSREPVKPPKKADRRYRTGRNIPLATKISKRANELLYGIHDQHKGADGNPTATIGEILERGLELYRAELDKLKADH